MERGGSEPPAGEPMASNVEALQLQLSEALAEIENIKAIATVSESTKQEAIDQVKRQCREEVASLQTIMKETISNYESQIENMERDRSQWRQYEDSKEREIMKLRRQLLGNLPQDNLENEMTKAQQDADRLRSIVMPMEQEIASLKEKLAKAEEQLSANSQLAPPAPHRWDAEVTWKGETTGPLRRPPKEWDPEDCDTATESQAAADTFPTNCGTWMTASGPTPGPIRPVPAGKEDTVSLLSTGTLVPESIYLPPPGHHLLLDEEWNELQQEVKQHKVSLHQTWEQLERETMVRKNLEEALRQSSEGCVQEIVMLKEKVESSAFEVQRIKELFTETQRRAQRQMVQVMVTQKELSQRNRELLRENQSLKLYPSLWNKAETSQNPATGQEVSVLQSVCPEESAASPVCEEPPAPGAGPSPDRSIELLTALQEKMVEAETLRTECKQQRVEFQMRIEEMTHMAEKLREEKAKGHRLQIELDTSEQVQRDFVKLSQALQVRLEQIRQADSLEAIQHILDSVSNLKDASQLQGAWDQGS